MSTRLLRIPKGLFLFFVSKIQICFGVEKITYGSDFQDAAKRAVKETTPEAVQVEFIILVYCYGT